MQEIKKKTKIPKSFFEGPKLYVLTDDKFLPNDLSDLSLEKIEKMVEACADGGAEIFQYRAKKLSAKVQLEQAKVAREVCRRKGILFFVDDRPDIAFLTGADGLHIGQDDIPPYEAKKIFKGIIGFSTHNLEQVKEANSLNGIDYISFGPIFGTTTKENPDPATGIELLEKAVAISNYPVVAIGGINESNVELVVKTGVWTVAVISAVFSGIKKEDSPELIYLKVKENVRKIKEKFFTT